MSEAYLEGMKTPQGYDRCYVPPPSEAYLEGMKTG